jgi:hypothetical protein
MSEQKKLITTNNIYYIKLGAKGDMEKYCIDNHVIYLGYGDVLTKEHHDEIGYCEEKIKDAFRSLKGKHTKGTISDYARQISSFYKADENTVFFTFHNSMLFWCCAEKKVTYKEIFNAQGERNDAKFKNVIGSWSNKDLNNLKELKISELNGSLTQVQGYRSTLCGISDDLKKYLLRKINGQEIEVVTTAKTAKNNIKKSIIDLMGTLNPKDFELLVDLVFSKSGWQRINSVGGTQKDIDIEMVLPTTGDKAFVQVKSKTKLSEMKEYFDKFSNWKELDEDIKIMFYVINSIENLSEKYEFWADEDNESRKQKLKDMLLEVLPSEKDGLAKKINILTGDKLAEMVLDAGLFNWLLKKAG